MNESLRYIVLMALFTGGTLLSSMAQADAGPKAMNGDAERGKTLFVRYCIGCHGPEGGGDGYRLLRGPDPANLTSPSTKKKSDAILLKTIHDGKPNMPPWKVRLSGKESSAVLAYVRTLAE